MSNRRGFIRTVGMGSLASMAPLALRAAVPQRVVVVGGGMAGATAAKYLRLWSNRTVSVTLVESSTQYTSNIMSNLVVTGQYTPTVLAYDWASLARNHGVVVVRGTVNAVDPGAAAGTWRVTVSNGSTVTTLDAERVVLAPGVAFDPVPSLADAATAAPVLHAWQAGPQTTQLRDFLRAMPTTGTFVLTIPKTPYRCPPGPYERACLVADYLRRNKPGAQVLVLDANAGIVAEAESFGRAFATLYPGNLTYRPNRRVRAVAAVAGQPGGTVVVDVVQRDAAGQEVVVGTEQYTAQLLNVIPPHRAGDIVQRLGLADATGFAPVDGRSFESTLPGKAGLHVVGDASRTALPKAGHAGNQAAKICADAILRAFAGRPPYPTPTANSACYSPVSRSLASWLTGVYQYRQDPLTGAWGYVAQDQVSGATGLTESRAYTSDNFGEMSTWYRTLMTETFA